MPRQLSGWTPVFPQDEPYGITFLAAAAAGDTAGIAQIEYELLEANKLGQGIVTEVNSGTPLPIAGYTYDSQSGHILDILESSVSLADGGANPAFR